MRNKTTGALLASMIVLAIVCIPAAVAFASAPGDAEQTTPPAVIEPTEPTDDATEPTEPEDVPEPPTPAALTPEGNLTLVDDIEGEQSQDKQFFTVITKNGNYFYLVIDRAGDTENVHFLNLVDESDLLALIEDTQPVPATTAPATTAPEPTEAVEPEPEPKPEESSLNIGAILAAIVALALAGGGALFYVKVLKPKRGAKATGEIDLDGFDFGDEDEDMPYGLADRDYTEPDIDIEDISEPGDSTAFDEPTTKEFGNGVEPETEETK
jgi:hypothetical protein